MKQGRNRTSNRQVNPQDGKNRDVKLNLEGAQHQATPGPASLIEQAIKQNVIPALYNHYGPGIISRQKKPVRLLPPAFQSILEKPYQEKNAVSNWVVTDEEKNRFIEFLLDQDEASALDFFGHLMERGATYEDACCGFMTEIAQTIGCNWEEDTMNFVEVTLASSTLMQLARTYGRVGAPSFVGNSLLTNALITPVPGETHILGALIVENFLKRAGWTVFGGILESNRALSVLLRKEWFTIVGISVSGNTWLGRCAKMIELVRAQSLNPDVVVMVGGNVFLEDPDNVHAVGADVVAKDAHHAVAIATGIERNLRAQMNGEEKNNKAYRGWMKGYPSLEPSSSKNRKPPSLD